MNIQENAARTQHYVDFIVVFECKVLYVLWNYRDVIHVELVWNSHATDGYVYSQQLTGS